eukprot:s6241_g3.t1
MRRPAGSGFLVLGALAYMAWGPSFTGSALKGCRPEGAVEYAGYVKVPFKGDERAAAYYTQRKGNGCWDHWGKSGEGETV